MAQHLNGIGILFSFAAITTAVAGNNDASGSWTLSAAAEGNAVTVNWSTSAEINSDYFIIQRSQDGVLFDDVMQEIAAGNSTSIVSYSITDYRPYSGTSFYRVVEVDVNGKLTQEVSTTAHFEPELSMTVNPGTSPGTFNVSIDGKIQNQVLLVVRDMQGREFFSKVILLRSVNEVVAIEPEGKLAQGIYTVVASSSNAIFEKKIVITK
jgi:hypothetical protein